MVFLKGLTFILFNLLLGFLIINSIRAILFFPRHKIYVFNKKVPGTPGLLYRKKEWLINKLHTSLHDYISSCQTRNGRTLVSRWENRVFDSAWEKFSFIDDIRLLPRKLRNKLHYIFALFFYEIARQFLRSFVPYLLEKYHADKYIVLLDHKLDMEIITGYYNRYINRYLMYFFLFLGFVIGLINMVWFFIIG
ncbi:MAG: hypothetical protein JXB60_00955 [Candidatus Cloacimonetes bacterium]|nr:hypothetical protein [Candidatus Cloacimonadota bacterium]